jgi:hypothetical protein
MYWSDGAGQFGSRFYIQMGAGHLAAPDLASYCTDVSAAWGTSLKAATQNNFALVKVVAQDLTDAASLSGTWQGSITGTSGTTEVPSSCCANIRFLIPQRYRGGHPLIHLPPPAGNTLANPRTWSGSFAGGMGTSFQTFINACIASTHGTLAGVKHVVPLGYRPGAVAADVILSQPSSYLCSQRVGSMRPRLTSLV